MSSALFQLPRKWWHFLIQQPFNTCWHVLRTLQDVWVLAALCSECLMELKTEQRHATGDWDTTLSGCIHPHLKKQMKQQNKQKDRFSKLKYLLKSRSKNVPKRKTTLNGMLVWLVKKTTPQRMCCVSSASAFLLLATAFAIFFSALAIQILSFYFNSFLTHSKNNLWVASIKSVL